MINKIISITGARKKGLRTACFNTDVSDLAAYLTITQKLDITHSPSIHKLHFKTPMLHYTGWCYANSWRCAYYSKQLRTWPAMRTAIRQS